MKDDSIQYYECPWCKGLLATETGICPMCGENQNIAVLVCSHPIGDVPAGMSWPLYPRSYTVGSEQSADIVIASELLPEEVLELKYIKGYYHIGNLSAEMATKVESKTRGRYFQFKMGKGELILQYVNRIKYSTYRRVAPQALEIVLSATCQILSLDDTEQIYEKVLDTVLRITGLDKGYYFTIRGMGLTMESARASGMSDLDRRFCGFNQTSIREAMAKKDIVCIDLDRSTDIHMTKSMEVLGLRKILCMPVNDGAGRISGIIYTDSQRVDVLSPDIMLFRPALRMLTKVLAFKLGAMDAGSANCLKDTIAPKDNQLAYLTLST